MLSKGATPLSSPPNSEEHRHPCNPVQTERPQVGSSGDEAASGQIQISTFVSKKETIGKAPTMVVDWRSAPLRGGPVDPKRHSSPSAGENAARTPFGQV